MINTNWSSPKTNIIAGLLDLRQALQGGQNARLIRARNEDCGHPIRVKQHDEDFRNYKFSIGYCSSVNKIKADPNLSDFEKHLSLNYISVFGSEEAMQHYYSTGELSADNFKNMGRNHLVDVDDYIKWLEQNKEYDLADMYTIQYHALEHLNDTQHLFNFFRPERQSEYSVKTFKNKLWVVELLDASVKTKVPLAITILNVLCFPLKFIPKKSVLRMPEYKVVTFRVGAVTSGFSVEFQIPKKFSFK